VRIGGFINSVAVVTDSVSCLPRELTEKYAIKIVPISLIINGNVYRDGVDITPTKVYQLLETTKSVPTTSSPSPGDFVQVYRELAKSVDGIVCVTICSDISMMFNSAIESKQIVAEELPGLAVNVVDSRTAGGAQGFVALAAARAAASGKDLAEVTRVAELMIPRVSMIAVLDTLYYLARAGRIPRIAAWAGSMLKINPILTFSHEGIGLLERARTKPRAVNRLLEIMEQRTGGKRVHVNIMHANVLEEAEALRESIESRFECVELFVTDFAPTMGVQAGPGTLALAFYSEEDGDVG
jgi:DegV family protein with EDD domain